MKKTENYCNRSQWEDCEELLDGTLTMVESDAIIEGHESYEKPLVHSLQIKSLFVAIALTIFTSSLVPTILIYPSFLSLCIPLYYNNHYFLYCNLLLLKAN